MGLFFSFLQIQEKGRVLILNLMALPKTPDSTLNKKSIHCGIFQQPPNFFKRSKNFYLIISKSELSFLTSPLISLLT